ncbi:hypothetical protein CEUSTIGMA_g13978.t1 [Chlamydomonas eustigma]|uniref:Uncharacterized protein n=1 Tax=Chlamydomonas eustigma TaxID=1157962 RepID=A0A250XU11_9CHLO|nr:hypothetical protein CEUSTIGMA_g13978.t1 [Chlamydomonas eustigma]|eukprot:GAX86571.1 hypothetical protein CEUSTIGMA_g13978.t1 [Chlamydomonas eustigma]
MEGVREESSSMSRGAGEKEGIVSQGERSGDAEEGVVSGGKEGAVGSNARQIHAPEVIGAESYPLLTMVFVMADEGKQYVAKHRRDAELVNAELVSLMLNILLQEEDGYFVKEQDGDLKYMVAFNNPAVSRVVHTFFCQVLLIGASIEYLGITFNFCTL